MKKPLLESINNSIFELFEPEQRERAIGGINTLGIRTTQNTMQSNGINDLIIDHKGDIPG